MPDPAPIPTTPPAPPAAAALTLTDALLRRGLFAVVLAMAAVVVGVAAAAFFLSFEAIRAFARHSGGIAPQHAWLAPLLVDSFIFVASAADLWFAATGTGRAAAGAWQRLVAALPKLLLAVAAGGSFALNVAHAPAHLGARTIAALPPVALVLTFEILLVIVRRAVAARVARLTAQHPAGVASGQPAETRTPATVRGGQPAPITPTTPPAPGRGGEYWAGWPGRGGPAGLRPPPVPGRRHRRRADRPPPGPAPEHHPPTARGRQTRPRRQRAPR
jgi:hypothetical protein